MKIGLGLSLTYGVEFSLSIHEHTGHKHHENGSHAIVVKTFPSLTTKWNTPDGIPGC